MSIDLRGALRLRKPDKRTARPISRPMAHHVDGTEFQGAAPVALVLETGVYIHSAAGRLPQGLRGLVDRALLFHWAVALADLFAQIPDTRLLTPDAQIFAEAGILAGMLARLQGYQPYRRTACLGDALIYLTAAEAGLPVLTANREDFDLIQQRAPDGQFIAHALG